MYIRGGKRDLSARSGRERERAARAAVDHPEARCSLYPFYSRLLPSDLYDSDAPSGSRFRGAHLPTTAKNIRPYTFHSPFFPLSSFYPSCIYCYHFLPERGRGELEERRRLRLSTTIIPIVLGMAVDDGETEKKGGSIEIASRSWIRSWLDVSGATMWRNGSMKFHRKTVGNRQQLEFEKSTPAVESGNRRV